VKRILDNTDNTPIWKRLSNKHVNMVS